jgi:Rps23 Pro-64 3,4-dihydroxylase Tpa1-like proline 4-hydroxylase
MKLIYSIPDKLYYIQNFLDYPTYKKIHSSIIKERKNINFHSSKGIWSKDLIENIIPPKKIEIENYSPFEKLIILTNNNQFYKLKNFKKNHVAIHYMEKGSGINWHGDGSWTYGATFYVNRRWNNNFGGEFMFKLENSYGYIPVVGNSLIIIKSPINHKVNPVLTSLVPRISVQMFIK